MYLDNLDIPCPITLYEVLGHEEYYYQLHLANDEWECKNGDIIPITEMKTSHIKHCMKLIYKSNGNWRKEYLPKFKKELINRKYNSEIDISFTI